MANVDAQFLECLDHHAGGGGPAHDHIAEPLGDAALRLDLGQKALPDGGHAPCGIDALIIHQPEDAGPVQRGAGHHHRQPHHGRCIGQAPGVDMKQRHDRQNLGAFGEGRPHHQRDHQPVQHGGPVRIKRALGIARGARRIAQAGRCILVHLRPVISGRLAVQQLLVAQRVEGVVRHMGAVGHDDIDQRRGQLILESFKDRHEGQVHEQNLVARMFDDIGHLLGAQTGVDRVAHGPDAGNGVIKLKMPVAVPCQRGDPVTRLDPHSFQRVGQLRHPRQRFGIGLAMDIAFGANRDDFCLRMRLGRIGQDVADHQRPVHHHALHVVLLPFAFMLGGP